MTPTSSSPAFTKHTSWPFASFVNVNRDLRNSSGDPEADVSSDRSMSAEDECRSDDFDDRWDKRYSGRVIRTATPAK
jgi:hypothetical protein